MLLVLEIILASIAGCTLGLALAKRATRRAVPARAEIPAVISGLPPAPRADDIVEKQNRQISQLQGTVAAMQGEAEMLIDRYRVLTENLAAAVVIRDADSRISYCSPYTEPLTGYALSEIYESPEDFFLSTIHEQDRELYSRALNYTKVGEPFEFRYRFYHKSGIEMWAETRTVPILGVSGEVVSSLSITLDATRSVRQQLQLEEKNRDLEEFAYMISHDLKAPIFTIKGMLGILKQDHQARLEGEPREIVEHITRAASRIEQLVSGVLEYSKISSQESRSETVDLKEVFADILQDFGRQLESSGGTIEIPEGLPQVLGDRLKLYQIFGNLIGNAIKYRSDKTPLEIEVQLETPPGGRTVQLCVKDNGLGIDADKLPSIFRPFQRAHGDEIEGTGIGLACVKKLVEKIGGSIAVRSELGTGSNFTVTLPAAPAES